MSYIGNQVATYQFLYTLYRLSLVGYYSKAKIDDVLFKLAYPTLTDTINY